MSLENAYSAVLVVNANKKEREREQREKGAIPFEKDRPDISNVKGCQGVPKLLWILVAMHPMMRV